MNIGIIGSGGREHALCLKLKQSKIVDKIYCFPGNAGTEKIAKNIYVDIDNFEEIKKKSLENKIELIVVGPEKPLVNGISDYFSDTNIKIFGPSKIASKLEGSKSFTKELCRKYSIPTSKFEVFENKDKASNYIENINLPIVIKADGLAAGKGVYICKEKHECEKALNEIFDGRFGEPKLVLIEEFLYGEEMSYFIISDGKNFKFFQTAQDHKRVGDGDTGPNTGGMGAYSPSRLYNYELESKIKEKIIYPTLRGLSELNTKYIGFLYIGLMIAKNEPFLIEFNVRMGDPECQTILPRLKTDFLEIIDATINKKLGSINLEWFEEKSICIVLCSKGYPDKFQNNVEIKKLEKIVPKNNNYIFHAGTKLKNSKIYSNGGRVLNFVIKSKNLQQSRDDLINLINDLNWENGYFRKDIGFKVFE